MRNQEFPDVAQPSSHIDSPHRVTSGSKLHGDTGHTMTKIERICQLYAHGIFTTREIADIVSKEMGPTRIEYVRVCARQRKGKGYSEIDQRYWDRRIAETGEHPHTKYTRERYRNDPEWREKRRAICREYYRRKKAEAA